MAQYLVTGGAGFIGSHLCRRLLADGHAVRVIDDLSSGQRDNLADIIDEVELVVGDLRDEALLDKVLRGVDYALHHAAVASVQTSVERPLFEQEVNAVGTLRFFEAARRAGVGRVVFAASAAKTRLRPIRALFRSLPNACSKAKRRSFSATGGNRVISSMSII